MTFSKYKISFYLFVLVLFAACEQVVPSKYDRIQTLLVDSLNIRKDYKAILVLEDGSCPSCQKALNAFMLQHIDNEDILFVVSNDERFVDLSELKTMNKENLIIDNKKLFYNKNIIEDSAVLVFKEKQLDTILVLSNSDVLQENLNYFSALVYP